jgi:phosphatidylglycerophosphatase A
MMPKCSIPVWLATLGGIGKSPVAPGTVATIVAGVPFAWLLGLLPSALAWVFLLALIGLSCYAADVAEKALQTPDPKQVVIDELVGYLITMIGLPVTIPSLLWGIAAFRLFDIWKPWPISWLDRQVPGGTGIVLDDLAAGVLAHGCVWIIMAAWG